MIATLTSAPASLKVSERIEERLRQGELTQQQVDDFRDFLAEVEREFLRHRIITDNHYTQWFQHGKATDEELRHFIQQFSVFSNQFLIAALQKVINSPSLEQSRASREILMNELGVIYRKPGQAVGERDPLTPSPSPPGGEGKGVRGNEEEQDREGDPELVSTEGTVDGGICRFRAAHFEWLTKVAEGVGLSFADIGKRKHGRPSTLHFCDELIRLYGSDDPHIAEGASFAVENWAAAGFWQELEDGLFDIKRRRLPQLRLAFFTWHNRVEGQHAGHTMEELEEVYFHPDFDRARFIDGGRQILDAIAVFWDGLEEDRKQRTGQ